MAAAIDALGLKKYNLVGTSMAARQRYGWPLHPDRVSSLIWKARCLSGRPLDSHGRGEGEGHDADDRDDAPPPRKPWANGEFIGEQFKRRFRVMSLVDSEFDDDLAARIGNVNIPTLVLYGAGDMIVQPSLGGAYTKIIPNSKSVTVEQAGHDIQGEQPEVFADTVRDFVEQALAARARHSS